MVSLRIIVLVALGVAGFILMAGSGAAQAGSEATERARKVVRAYTTQIRPLEVKLNRLWWAANISGADKDFKDKAEAQNRLDEALADKDAFAEVKAVKEAGGIDDPILARAVDVIYLARLEKQVDPALLKKITAKANAVEQAFNVYRANVDGKEMTDSQVRKVLKESKDSARRQAVWEASKKVGQVVEADLKKLVALRNQAAVKLGYKNFHALQLYLNEQNGDDLIQLFDKLDDLTREPFRTAKAEVDRELARSLGIKTAELMPWHYHDPFFQETPSVFSANLDKPYATADLPKLASTFYQGIGLPIDDVIARSDLYEKPGKSPHAFCTDIDREGDVRVLANVKNNEYWMGTLLHEFGHSVYSSKNIPARLPYVLRAESHILTTEGVAMLFEKFSKKAAWLKAMGIAVDDPAAFDETGAKMLRYQLLIFSRWCQVMLRFEKSMYENPDQDLNKLWWDLVEKYQMVKRPKGRKAPDYGSKIHIVSAPVYYHNYMMGQLWASQVHHAVARDVFQGADPASLTFVGRKEVGAFFKKKIFDPGRTLSWNQLTEFATGAKLNPEAFAMDFKGK
jgi:peptidyl-dipeptidase A